MLLIADGRRPDYLGFVHWPLLLQDRDDQPERALESSVEHIRALLQ